MLGITVQPNRRHRCEICDSIFECHLCDTTGDHVIHVSNFNRKTKLKIYICINCAKKEKLLYIAQMKNHSIANIYDYLTGKIINKVVLYNNAYNIKRWFSEIPATKLQLLK